MAGGCKSFEAFFSSFSDFDYQLHSPPESEFRRLRQHQGWSESSKTFKKHRESFLLTLAAEAYSPLHTFFIETYRFPLYDPAANPRAEFDRLADYRKWKPTNRPYKRAKESFESKFEFEFGGAILDFFEEYETKNPAFKYNPRNRSEEEFHRMCKVSGWESGELRISAWDDFIDAIYNDFNDTFGRNDDDIAGWKFLCEILGIKAPESVEGCKKELEGVFVNIFDLLDYARLGIPRYWKLKFFESVYELAEYSYESDPEKVFPKSVAKRGALMFLLREISRAYRKLEVKGAAKRRKGKRRKGKGAKVEETVDGTTGKEGQKDDEGEKKEAEGRKGGGNVNEGKRKENGESKEAEKKDEERENGKGGKK